MATRYQQQQPPQQAAAAAVSYAKRPIPPGAAQRPPQGMLYPGNAVPFGARFGDEIEEAGGIGDQIDTLSVRDVATVRYIRHHEWLELIVGSGLDTNKIIPPKVIPESQSQLWTFELDSLRKKLETTEQEVKSLEAQKEAGWTLDVNPRNKELADFFRRGTAKLREQFGTISENDLEAEMAQELEDRFQLRIIDREQLRRVGVDLGLGKDEPKESNVDSEMNETESKQVQIEQTHLDVGPSDDQLDIGSDGDRLDISPGDDQNMEDIGLGPEENNDIEQNFGEDEELIPNDSVEDQEMVDNGESDPNQNDLADMFPTRDSPALSGDGLDDVLSLTPQN
jgi:hypothetical protein